MRKGKFLRLYLQKQINIHNRKGRNVEKREIRRIDL